jgi:hypothetical protein
MLDVRAFIWQDWFCFWGEREIICAQGLQDSKHSIAIDAVIVRFERFQRLDTTFQLIDIDCARLWRRLDRHYRARIQMKIDVLIFIALQKNRLTVILEH